MSDRPSESCHWYKEDGTPAYTIIGKNGKERNTTLRDARTLKLVPSVTSIINCGAKPGLINWMIDQAIMCALTLTRTPDETDIQYLDRIKKDSQERAKKARERGTLIHAWVQQGFEGATLPDEATPFYQSAWKVIWNEVMKQEWICEKSFTQEKYGGKIDLSCEYYIIDFKTTDKPLDNCKLWDEHYMQLAAYRQNGQEKCGICFINSVEPTARLIWADESELIKGWQMFQSLKDYWYAKTGL